MGGGRKNVELYSAFADQHWDEISIAGWLLSVSVRQRSQGFHVSTYATALFAKAKRSLLQCTIFGEDVDAIV